MKITKFVNNEFLKGEIVFNTLPYSEKVKQSAMIFSDVSNENVMDEEGNKIGDRLVQVALNSESGLAMRLFELAKKQIEKVSLKVLSGEHEGLLIESVEDLYEFQESATIASQITNQLIGGIQLGEKQKNLLESKSVTPGEIQG